LRSSERPAIRTLRAFTLTFVLSKFRFGSDSVSTPIRPRLSLHQSQGAPRAPVEVRLNICSRGAWRSRTDVCVVVDRGRLVLAHAARGRPNRVVARDGRSCSGAAGGRTVSRDGARHHGAHLPGARLGSQRPVGLGKSGSRPRSRCIAQGVSTVQGFEVPLAALASACDGGRHRRCIGEYRTGPSAPKPQPCDDYAAGEFIAGTRAAAPDFPLRPRCYPRSQPGCVAVNRARLSFEISFPTSLSSWPCRLRSPSKWRKDGAPPSVPIGSRGAYEFRTKTKLGENDRQREGA
jgi:hypothetical protein